MKSSLERIYSVLEQLAQQAQTTDAANEHLKSHNLLKDQNLFSQNLFVTNSDKIYPYVKEVQQKTAELSRLLDNNKRDLSHNRLQQIEQQISALINALNANTSIHKEAQHRLDAFKSRKYKKIAQNIMLSSQALYQKLAEHHEFERRLMAMLDEREQLRTNAPPSKVDKFTAEVLALHQRLGRCRQAISKIERQIELSEKR